MLAEAAPADVAIEAFTAVPIGPDVQLVTYRSIARIPGAPARPARRASIWVRRAGRWRLRFHQGTAISPDEQALG